VIDVRGRWGETMRDGESIGREENVIIATTFQKWSFKSHTVVH
jgi:hypothetical protein